MTDDEGPMFVARRGTRPQVWLGERESASDVTPRLGARFPATATKERDFVFDISRGQVAPQRDGVLDLPVIRP